MAYKASRVGLIVEHLFRVKGSAGMFEGAADCLCDVDYHCDLHDRDAEAAWWGARHRSEPVVDESLAYDRDNYKHPEWAALIV